MSDTQQLAQLLNEELGIQALSPEDQATIRSNIGEAILARVITSVYHELAEEDRAEFEGMRSLEEIQPFFAERIPDLEQRIGSIASYTLEEYKVAAKS